MNDKMIVSKQENLEGADEARFFRGSIRYFSQTTAFIVIKARK